MNGPYQVFWDRVFDVFAQAAGFARSPHVAETRVRRENGRPLMEVTFCAPHCWPVRVWVDEEDSDKAAALVVVAAGQNKRHAEKALLNPQDVWRVVWASRQLLGQSYGHRAEDAVTPRESRVVECLTVGDIFPSTGDVYE